MTDSEKGSIPARADEATVGLAAPSAPASDGVILRTSGLVRSFGSVRAVDGLDLAVHSGEVYGFLGVNGAGKTTTIRMLMGIIKPEAGTIEILGERTRRTTVRQKQSIGYVSQEQTFYPWMTCRALGRFVGGFYPSWDLAEFERLLRVLDLPADRRASQLSGGMRVKLALALALAPRPALLILDEPTSGLDPVARREFLDLIRMQARQYQRTTFFSSHIIGEVERVADRVGIIHHGRMLYEGRLEELRASVRQVCIRKQVEGVEDVAGATPERAGGIPPIMPVLPLGVKAEDATGTGDSGLPLTNTGREAVDARSGQECPRPEGKVPGGYTLPEGFQTLRQEQVEDGFVLTIRADPSAWNSFALPGAEVRDLSVEDIFIALVATPAALI